MSRAAKLSEEQRNELLREAMSVAAAAPVRPGREYQHYDFTRPDRLSNEQKRLLRNQFEPVCRLLCIHFNNALRTVVEMWLMELDEIRYRDVFVGQGLSGKSMVCTFSPGPGQPQGLMVASLGLLFAFLERMMGGTTVTEIADKDLSEFEKQLFGNVLTRILTYYARTFQEDGLRPEVERIETEAALIPRTYAPEESMVRQIFRISLNGYIGHVSVILPFDFFLPRLPQIRTIGSRTQTGPVDPARVEELGVVDVPMLVELGRAHLDLKRLMELAPGDVVVLDGAVTVMVGDVPKFVAKPGLMGDHLAVEIVKPVLFEEKENLL